jgi:LPS sulfotransferase NodH
MGYPVEYFNTVFYPAMSARWGCGNLDQFLTGLLQRRTDASGGFSIKMHWAHLAHFFDLYRAQQGQPPLLDPNSEEAHRERYRFLQQAFPNPRFIQSTRLNRVRQAVSWYVGSLTGEWARLEGEAAPQRRGPLPYDLDKILAYLVALDAAEASWREFFRINQIQPITVLYEELETDYLKTMEATLSSLGVTSVALPQPRLKKQADETTELLIQQAVRDLSQAALML